MLDCSVVELLDRIEKSIEDMGISKEQFYEESGISSASMSQWRTGVHRPTTKKLKQAADYLGVSLKYILTGEEKPPAAQEGDGLTDVQRELMDLVRSMTPEEASVLVATARALIASGRSPGAR